MGSDDIVRNGFRSHRAVELKLAPGIALIKLEIAPGPKRYLVTAPPDTSCIDIFLMKAGASYMHPSIRWSDQGEEHCNHEHSSVL
jgi:hypothetical protein